MTSTPDREQVFLVQIGKSDWPLNSVLSSNMAEILLYAENVSQHK